MDMSKVDTKTLRKELLKRLEKDKGRPHELARELVELLPGMRKSGEQRYVFYCLEIVWEVSLSTMELRFRVMELPGGTVTFYVYQGEGDLNRIARAIAKKAHGILDASYDGAVAAYDQFEEESSAKLSLLKETYRLINQHEEEVAEILQELEGES